MEADERWDLTTLTGRLRAARKDWEKRNPDISQAKIGQGVGAILGVRVEQKKVSRWFSGQEPTLAELGALAIFFGVDVCNLAFGPPAQRKRGPRPLVRRSTREKAPDERRA